MRAILILALLTITSVSASPSADRADLLDQLHAAKLAGDRARAMELEEELARLRGETLSFIAQPADKGAVPNISDDPFEPVRYFSEDKPIVNIDEDQVLPSLAWDSDGTLWAAYEDLGHDQELHLCKSEDGGVTWLHVLGQSVVPPVNPALAIGEGDERWLLMVFEAADQYIWVYRLNLDTNDVDLALIADNELGVANPQIVTDSDEYLGWYAYVTFENRDYDGWNVVFSRSLNFGEDWVGMGYVGGQTTWDGYNGRDGYPDIDFGSQNLSVVYDNTMPPDLSTRDVFISTSEDYGASWPAPIQLTSGEDDEFHPVVGIIRGYTDAPTTVVGYTRYYESLDYDARYAFTQDDGETWVEDYCFGCSYNDEVGVNITTSKETGYLHAAYHKENDIEYRWAPFTDPTSLSGYIVVNRQNTASRNYPRPGLTVDPTVGNSWHEICVAWTDIRDLGTTAYDIYFNRREWPYAEAGEMSAKGDMDLAWMNPALNSVVLEFTLSAESPVYLAIHDVEGRRVRLLESGGVHSAGQYHVGWDGRDEQDRAISPGLYYGRLIAQGREMSVRGLLLR